MLLQARPVRQNAVAARCIHQFRCLVQSGLPSLASLPPSLVNYHLHKRHRRSAGNVWRKGVGHTRWLYKLCHVGRRSASSEYSISRRIICTLGCYKRSVNCLLPMMFAKTPRGFLVLSCSGHLLASDILCRAASLVAATSLCDRPASASAHSYTRR